MFVTSDTRSYAFINHPLAINSQNLNGERVELDFYISKIVFVTSDTRLNAFMDYP